jgi:hypothetical protein
MNQTKAMVTIKVHYSIPVENGLQSFEEEVRVPQGVKLMDSWDDVVKQLKFDRFAYGRSIEIVFPLKYKGEIRYRYNEIVPEEGDTIFCAGSLCMPKFKRL